MLALGYGTYVSGIHPLAAPIQCSTQILLIWKRRECGDEKMRGRGGGKRNLAKIQPNNHTSTRQRPHPTHTSLISHCSLMWPMPNAANVCGALCTTHMPRTWLYTQKALNPLNPCSLSGAFKGEGNVNIQRTIFMRPSFSAPVRKERMCLLFLPRLWPPRGPPATRQLPLKCLKMAVCFQSMSRERRRSSSCQNRRVVEITCLTSVRTSRFKS